MDKEDKVHSGILLRHKSESSVAICSKWKDLEGMIPSELSHAEREKCCRSHIYVESKKYYTMANITKQKQTQRYREQASYTRGQGAIQRQGEGAAQTVRYETGSRVTVQPGEHMPMSCNTAVTANGE